MNFTPNFGISLMKCYRCGKMVPRVRIGSGTNIGNFSYSPKFKCPYCSKNASNRKR